MKPTAKETAVLAPEMQERRTEEQSIVYQTTHENVTLTVSVDLSGKETITQEDLRDILSDKYARCSKGTHCPIFFPRIIP